MDDVVRPIFLLTDFGTRSHYAGQVRALLQSLSPRSPIVDLTHEVEPFAIDEAAWLLETALPVIPERAVILAVVDPGVGTDRAPIVVQSGHRYFVGPDNGLLSPAFPEALRERLEAPSAVSLPAFAVAHRLENPAYRRATVSQTFHGRDIFAPAAAAVARGVPPGGLGQRVPTAVLLPPFRGRPRGDGRSFEGYVVHIDRYGNLVTTVQASQCGANFAVTIAGCRIAARTTFAEAAPGDLVSHVDSSGFVAVACNRGNAAHVLGVGRGAPVMVETA